MQDWAAIRARWLSARQVKQGAAKAAAAAAAEQRQRAVQHPSTDERFGQWRNDHDSSSEDVDSDDSFDYDSLSYQLFHMNGRLRQPAPLRRVIELYVDMWEYEGLIQPDDDSQSSSS